MDLKQHIKNILKEETNESLLDDLGNFFRFKKRVEVDPSTIQSEKEKFTCEDCGDPNYQMYMVDDDIWREFGNNTNTLCMSCLEKRMGRKLTKHDFSQHRSAPVNKHNLEVQDILTESVKEHVSDLKKPFMKYEKLINKLVYDVFDEGICGLSWDVIKLHHREGISIRIILYFTYDSLKDFGYERYGQSKQELKGLIEDYLPKFDGIYIAYDTTKCDDTHKEEETEGVGGYAAPAFEMKPDHVHFKHQYNEETELTEKCWKGYTQKGMKTMFGKRYPNCVKKKNKSLKEYWTPKEEDYSNIESAINKIIPKSFSWFKEIEIDNISYSEFSNTLTIYGELKVDEKWGAKQWREYYEYKPFPSNSGWEEEDPVRLGDIIGKGELDDLNDELELIVSSVGGYSIIDTMRLGQLKLYFV